MTRKPILLISAYALIILLTGMIIILSSVPQATVTIETKTTAPVTSSLSSDSPMTLKTINPIIGLIIFLAIIAAIAAVGLMAKGGMTKQAGVVGGWVAGLLASVGGKKIQFVAALGGYLLLLFGISHLWPALWEWLRNQKFLFWWVVIIMPIVAAATLKFKYVWGVVITGVIIAILGIDWATFPIPLDWRQPDLIKANEAAQERGRSRVIAHTDPAARAVSSELGVVKKTTVLLPNSPPQKISFPPNVIGWWETSDCVKITDGLGETYDYCPGQKLDLGSNVPPTKAVLTFQHSKMDSEITVWYGWKLK